MTPARLREVLRYEPETGKLFWRARNRSEFKSDRAWNAWNAKNAGREAMTFVAQRGHRRGTIDGRQFLAHRVAWAIHYGSWPQGDLDHKNVNPADNRIANLRPADTFQNRWNVPARGGASRFKGVKRNGARWQAGISANCRYHYLGTFDDEIDAAKAYDAAAQRLHGPYAKCNFQMEIDI